MSVEEGPELRDLIAQTLEKNGVLAKIRAELRASVFLAIEDQTAFQTKLPFINQPLRTFLKTSEGAFITCLVREFLEFFNLDFTLSVFDPETLCGKEYSYGGRMELIKDLKIQEEKNVPVLSHILQNVLKCHNTPAEKDTLTTIPSILSLPLQDDKRPDCGQQINRLLDVTFTEDPVAAQTIKNHKYQTKHAATEESISVSMKEDSSKISNGNENDTFSSLELLSGTTMPKKETDHGATAQYKNHLTSLSNLPPLAGMVKTDSKLTRENSPDHNKFTKALTNIGVESVDNYEEDFQSSVSGSGNVGRSGKSTTPGSDTEIEEDIGIDEILSNASGTEDLTVDVTASNTSAVADYLENIS